MEKLKFRVADYGAVGDGVTDDGPAISRAAAAAAAAAGEKAVVFGLSFEKIAHADVLLNVSPFFNHGAHDRIFAGMANHCTVLTDQNPYLKRILKDGEQVCMYSLKDIRTLSDYAAELLTNHALCRDIQNNAYVEFKQKYTWEEKAKQLLACTLR